MTVGLFFSDLHRTPEHSSYHNYCCYLPVASCFPGSSCKRLPRACEKQGSTRCAQYSLFFSRVGVYSNLPNAQGGPFFSKRNRISITYPCIHRCWYDTEPM